MSQPEINALEDAGRSAMAWAPDAGDDRPGSALRFGTMAFGILALAAVFLFVAF